MPKTIVRTDRAPGAIGPYSQAVKVGDLVLCSGQIAIDPKTGELVRGDVATETRQVMKNLGEVLAAAGASFQHVVRTTIFLKSMSDFSTVNRVYGEYFGSAPPARATVQVAALPKGAAVEIDAIAHLGAGT